MSDRGERLMALDLLYQIVNNTFWLAKKKKKQEKIVFCVSVRQRHMHASCQRLLMDKTI